MRQTSIHTAWNAMGLAMALTLMPALALAQEAPRCTFAYDVAIGDRCASDWMVRALAASAVIVLIGVVWRALSARAGQREWHHELDATEQRGAELGDMTPVAAGDPAEAARILQRALGIGAAAYARRERHRAFEQGDIAAAGAWQRVERLIERESGAH